MAWQSKLMNGGDMNSATFGTTGFSLSDLPAFMETSSIKGIYEPLEFSADMNYGLFVKHTHSKQSSHMLGTAS